MFKKILSKAFSVIRRMNDWWDRDEDKEVASIISAIIILLGILILKKPILFVVALVLLTNRVMHRFDVWDKLSISFDDSYDDTHYDDTVPAEVFETKESEFDKPESIIESGKEKTIEEDESKE
jgi:hypothetical protein